MCGNIIEVLGEGAGRLVCCGQPMELLTEKTKEQGQEKHVPVLEKIGDQIKVVVGEVPHPMETEHFIEWVEIVQDGRVQIKYLQPGEKPEAIFQCGSGMVFVRAYCNVHGLWRARGSD